MSKFVFVLLCVLSFASYGQPAEREGESEIPNDIQQYYKKLNFVNAISTTPEKSAFVENLRDGKSQKTPDSKREYFIVNLLQDVMSYELQSQNTMPGSDKNDLVKSGILFELQHGQQSEKVFTLSAKTYQVSIEDNYKLIRLFDEDKLRWDDDIMLLSNPTFIATEIHKWIFINNKWSKEKINIVLTE